MRVRRVAASAVLALAVAVPARAQKGKAHKSTPPSRTTLPNPVLTLPAATTGAVPFAWVDDASILAPGQVSVSISTLLWQGTDLNEVDVPVVGVGLGIANRVQIGASIPRVVGSSDPTGVEGGLGTTFLSGKVGVLTGTGSGLRLAVAPTLEILGTGALQGLAPGEGRTQFGLPVSAEVVRNGARVFGSAGYFSSGIWFAGGGVGGQVTPRIALSAAFSRAWTRDAPAVAGRDRTELSGGAAFSPTHKFSVFGSLGTTIGTTDENGAGTTVTGGVLFLLAPAAK